MIVNTFNGFDNAENRFLSLDDENEILFSANFIILIRVRFFLDFANFLDRFQERRWKDRFEGKYCQTANIIIPRIYPPRIDECPLSTIINIGRRGRVAHSAKRRGRDAELRNNNLVSMDRLRMRTNSRRSSVIIGFDYIYIYVYVCMYIYIHARTAGWLLQNGKITAIFLIAV